MSEAFWIALIGILGVLAATLLQHRLQHNSESSRIRTELFVTHEIQSLQQLQQTFVECQDAYRSFLGTLQDQQSILSAFNDLTPKFQAFQKAYSIGSGYLPSKEHGEAMALAYMEFRDVLGKLREVSSNPSISYTIDEQKLDSFGVTQLCLRAGWAISTALKPSRLPSTAQ